MLYHYVTDDTPQTGGLKIGSSIAGSHGVETHSYKIHTEVVPPMLLGFKTSQDVIQGFLFPPRCKCPINVSISFIGGQKVVH